MRRLLCTFGFHGRANLEPDGLYVMRCRACKRHAYWGP